MKKILSIVLTLVMCASVVGCGKTQTDESSTDYSSAKAESSKEDDASDESDVIISSAEVVFPQESAERMGLETEARETLNEYLVARAYLDKFLQYDIENGNLDEYTALLNSTVSAFECVESSSALLEKDAKTVENLEAYAAYVAGNNSGSYKVIVGAKDEFTLSDLDPFVMKAYAAEDSEAVKWAKEITETFDKAPVGKGIRTLAEQMGTDAKHAYAQLKQAQDILAGSAYEDFAQTADTAYKTAKVLKTAGTAAQLTLSIITAEPVTMTETVMACGGILVNGFNTMLEVGQTGSVLLVGDDNKFSQTLENIENATGPIGSVIGCYGLASNLAKGKELLSDAPAIADSIMYITSSITDYVQDGKILGGSFTQAKDGSISCTICETMTIKSAWAKEPEKAKEILEAIGYTEEEISRAEEKAVEAAESVEPLAEIPDEFIETILAENVEVVTAIETQTGGLVDDGDTLSADDGDDVGGDSLTDDDTDSNLTADDDSSDSDSGKYPSAEELAGYYPFYMYMTYQDQSAEGENPQTIRCISGNTLEMEDMDGEVLTGTYDPSTGKVEFSDESISSIIVSFTKENGKIRAKLSASGYGLTMSGTATKQ